MLTNYGKLKTNAAKIKQEVEDVRNTAERVGGEMLDFVESANVDILEAQRLKAFVEGGRIWHFASVKGDASQVMENCRIYSNGVQGESGYILGGSTATTLLAFAVSAGERFSLSGLRNDPVNDSICWAVYSSYITLSSDTATQNALKAAFVKTSSEAEYLPAREDVCQMLTIPSGGAMLVVSIPYNTEDDLSDVRKYMEAVYRGLTRSVEDNANEIADINETIEGGESQTYISIKSSGVIYESWRIYGDENATSGNILAGDDTASIIAFHVAGGQEIRLGGLKNSDNNPSLCWAIYSEYITPATDASTSARLTAALLERDPSAEPRTDVSATLTMPTGAQMLIVSIPSTGDASTIERLDASQDVGLRRKINNNAANIENLASRIAVLPTMHTSLNTLQKTQQAQGQRVELLQECVAVKVKSLITTARNEYGMINGGRITSDGKIVRGDDGNTTYIIALSAFNSKRFSAGGLASNANNPSRCWAVYNIPASSVDWATLTNPPYMLDWSQYLMTTYSDPDTSEGRTNKNVEDLNLNGTGATFLVFSCLTDSATACDPFNFDTGQITELKANASKAATLITLRNVLGRPTAWNARTTATTGTITATMTINDAYANVKIVTSAASSGRHGLWLGFEAHNVIAGHKYQMLLRYRGKSGVWGASYYNSALTWSGDGYVRNNLTDASDYNKWQFDKGGQFFTAPSSGDLWIDFIVYVHEATSGAATMAEFDMLPLLIDVTDTDFTCDSLAALMEDAGVFYDTLVLSNYATKSLYGATTETLVTLGDSTTGIMCWQPQLARIKGWNWDERQIEGRTFNGVGAPRTAMGIGGTCVEPVIYGDGTSDTGCSQYIRAQYVKYYEPTTIIVMSSYNGAHAGTHWGGDTAKPVQPADYGLAELIASGMNTETGTYNGTYTGGEIDLVSNPSQSAPSFAASYFGMVYRLVVDNPAARIILVTLMNDFEPSNSAYLDLKNAVIEKAGEVFHLQVIDANKCGINRTNRLTTRYDGGGVHFNIAGGTLLAKYIASQT